MVHTSGFSHPQHRSHLTHAPRLSPASPQLWIRAVYKPVNNLGLPVRFATNVRLSPPVDHLWTDSALDALATPGRCVYRRTVCAHITLQVSSSPTIHRRGSCTPTHSPQAKTRGLRGIKRLIHTFPSTYDDDYRYRSMDFHTNNEAPTVDDSRTLMPHTTFEGGNE